MKKVFLIVSMLAASCVMTEVSAQTTGDTNPDDYYHKPQKGPNLSETPQVSYDSASTVLNVMFSSNSQGGKVEIYRNGIKVVNTTAPAGISLCYILRNYGKGEFKIVVSQWNTVVYGKEVIVK